MMIRVVSRGYLTFRMHFIMKQWVIMKKSKKF